MLYQAALVSEHEYFKPLNYVGDGFEYNLGSTTNLEVLDSISVNDKTSLKNCRKDLKNPAKEVKFSSSIKKKKLKINFYNTKYTLIKTVAHEYGFKEVEENDNWIVQWTDNIIRAQKLFALKRNQKLNHFPGMVEICRKDNLCRNLNRMKRLFPNDYDITPKTWNLPNDIIDIRAYFKRNPGKTYILKPDASCRGQGIFLSKNINKISSSERMVCQEYVKPFLIDGYKFDLRLYVLVTSVDPLRIYIYREGLVRFTTIKYEEPSDKNIKNLLMHLTNYSLQKDSNFFIPNNEEGGTKRRLSWLYKWFREHKYNARKIWNNIDEVIIKTIITIQETLKINYHSCFDRLTTDKYFGFQDKSVSPSVCFELLGFDILLNSNMKPILMEVNHSPSLHTDADIDLEIKHSLLWDTFEILNLHKSTAKLSPDNKDINQKKPIKIPKTTIFNIIQSEASNKGNYRLIYPLRPSTNMYSKYVAYTPSVPRFNLTNPMKQRIDHYKLYGRNRVFHEENFYRKKKKRFVVVPRENPPDVRNEMKVMKNPTKRNTTRVTIAKNIYNPLGSSGDEKLLGDNEGLRFCLHKKYPVDLDNQPRSRSRTKKRALEINNAQKTDLRKRSNTSWKGQVNLLPNPEKRKQVHKSVVTESKPDHTPNHKNECFNISDVLHKVIVRQTTLLQSMLPEMTSKKYRRIHHAKATHFSRINKSLN